MDDPVILAIVLTYCAPRSLARCLEGIDRQTRPPDGLLVVDNTGPPLSAVELSGAGSCPRRVVRTGENLGPAGGHARGLAEFLADGRWTHAWVMDDDCVPEPDSLAWLVDRSQSLPERSLVLPTWLDGHTKEVENAPAWCGFLVSRPAVELVGLPRAELFWWCEDTEYLQYRMPRQGVVVVRERDARVWHWPVRRTADRPPWKIYYEVRNSTWYRLHVQRSPRAVRRWLFTVVKVVAALLRDSPSTAHFSALVLGLVHGIRGKLGRTMLPPRPPVHSSR